MATVVNNPRTTDSGGGMGFLLGVILLILFAMFLMFYGLPYLGNMVSNQAPQVTVPDKIDVNVNQPK